MNFKRSLLIALLSLGIIQCTPIETDEEKFKRAYQFSNQQNYSDAFPLFQQLAEQGNADAQGIIGEMYHQGLGVIQNYKQAIYWYKKSAEQGQSYAQTNLGLMYYQGKGVARNYKQAAYWYSKAAEQGVAEAKFNLGLMYTSGEGVQIDLSKAKQLFKQACDTGDSYSCKYYDILDKSGVR